MAIVVIAQNLVDSSPSLGKGLRAKMEEKHSQGHCIETTQLNETFAEQNAFTFQQCEDDKKYMDPLNWCRARSSMSNSPMS